MFLKEINMINSRRINHIAQEEITQKHLVYIEISTAILGTLSVHSVLSHQLRRAHGWHTTVVRAVILL